jgi:hypothetical protein
VSTCSFKWHKAAVLIAVLALCCFVFAGTALAASVTVTGGLNPTDDPVYGGKPTNVLKANHNYDLTIEGTGLEAPLNAFCSDVPFVDPGSKALIVDFPFTLESDNFTGAVGKQVSAYLTIEGESDEYLVTVVPEIFEEPGTCLAEASVADRVYFVIERQSIALPSNAKVTGFRIEGLSVLTPRTPDQNYQVCVSHTEGSCFTPICTVLEVVETVYSVELAEVECAIAGSEATVTGQVYDTRYDDQCGYAQWTGKASWPVVLCPMLRVEVDVDCYGNPVYEYVPLPSPLNAEAVYDCNGNQICYDDCDNPDLPCVITSTKQDGSFSATLRMPASFIYNGKCYDINDSIVVKGEVIPHDIVVIAKTVEVKDENADSCIYFLFNVPAYQVPAESKEDAKSTAPHLARGLYEPACEDHAWIKSEDLVIEVQTGTPYSIKADLLPDQIEIANSYDPNCCEGECASYEIDIWLLDKYCNVTKNADLCDGSYEAHPIKVDLKAFYLENGKKKLAGVFYDQDPFVRDPETGECSLGTDGKPVRNTAAKVIDYTSINEDSVKSTVYFEPTKAGLIDLEYSAIINQTNRIWQQCDVEVNYAACLLEVTPLVTSDNCFPGHDWRNGGVSDGWPIKVSVHYESDVPLRVEILNPDTYKPFNFKGGPDDFLVTWDTEAYAEDGILEFEAEGRYGHGDYLDHPFGNVPYDNNKSDFFVYPVNACGESFIIKVVDEANNIKDEVEIGPLASATELVRILEPSKWQVLSTPKTLAGSGDLLSLFDGETPYNEALTYKNNQWVPVMPYDELEPLYAYVINTQQNWCQDACPGGDYCGENLPIYAKYVFDRVTDPSLTLLPERLLTAGANLVGPSFNESEIMLPFELEQEFLEFSPLEKKYMPCFFYEECCTDNDGCCNCDVPSLDFEASDICGPICPEQLFQFDTLARMTATFCEGCSMIANYGGDSAGDCRNSRGNLAFFSTAALGGSNAQSWLTDPLHFAFNGDGYLAYVNGAQTYTGAAQLELVNIAP